MATSNLPVPTLQPVPLENVDPKLAEIVEEGASCCGGGCCS
ncbi:MULTISPECIES: hypothetical protein [unclassified Microbacterium]